VDRYKGDEEYIEFLYDKASKPVNDEVEPLKRDADDIEPDLFYEKFLKALSELKNGKAVGIDCIPAEILKVVGHTGK